MSMITLPETNIAPENRPNPKWKQSYSNHPFFRRKLAVSFREGIFIYDITIYYILGGGNSNIFFTPQGRFPFWQAYFSNGDHFTDTSDTKMLDIYDKIKRLGRRQRPWRPESGGSEASREELLKLRSLENSWEKHGESRCPYFCFCVTWCFLQLLLYYPPWN